jgi:hypothetical protein
MNNVGPDFLSYFHFINLPVRKMYASNVLIQMCYFLNYLRKLMLFP